MAGIGSARGGGHWLHFMGRRGMLSLLIHAALGFASLALFFYFNACLYKPGWNQIFR